MGELSERGEGQSVSFVSRMGASYFPIAFIARLPFAMVVIGVLTLAVSARGSVELGGLTSAVVGLGVACCGPLIGAAADRFGQRGTLLTTALLNAAILVGFAWLAYSELPNWVMFIGSFFVGATVPQISPMSRSRVVGVIASEVPVSIRSRTLSSVFAYESAADEVIFVFGPVLVGALATFFGAWSPLVGASFLTLVFVTAFAVHPSGKRPRFATGQIPVVAPVAELFRPALIVTVIGIFSVGLFFGSMLTSLTSFMQDRGEPEQAGLLYGVMGVGSAVFAVGLAWVTPRFTLRYRWLVFALLILGGAIALQNVHDVMSMTVSLGIMGFGIGPLLVTLYSFGAHRTPRGRSATVMAMLGSSIIVGQSVAAAVTGIVAENAGTEASLLLPLAAAIIAVVSGVVNWFLSSANASSDPDL